MNSMVPMRLDASDFLEDFLPRTLRVAQQRVADFEFEFDVAATVNRLLQPRDFPGDRLCAGDPAIAQV